MKHWTLIFLLLSGFASADVIQDEEPSQFKPQQDRKAGPIQFHVIPDFAVGAIFEEQQISQRTTEAFFQVRVPGLVLPGINSTNTGFAMEFSNPRGVGIVRFRFISYTRIPIAGGFFTGTNLQVAEGTKDFGTETNFNAEAIVGFNLATFYNTATLSFEVGLFKPEEPVRFAAVIGF